MEAIYKGWTKNNSPQNINIAHMLATYIIQIVHELPSAQLKATKMFTAYVSSALTPN